MKTLTTLLLTLGLCGLSLPAFSANESCDVSTDGALNVADIVQMVNAILGTQTVTCAGPGCDAAVADATSGMFTQAQMDAAVADAVAAAATPEAPPNCFLMGLCGQDGAAQYGVDGPYSQMSIDDAVTGDGDCGVDYLTGAVLLPGAWWVAELEYACD